MSTHVLCSVWETKSVLLLWKISTFLFSKVNWNWKNVIKKLLVDFFTMVFFYNFDKLRRKITDFDFFLWKLCFQNSDDVAILHSVPFLLIFFRFGRQVAFDFKISCVVRQKYSRWLRNSRNQIRFRIHHKLERSQLQPHLRVGEQRERFPGLSLAPHPPPLLHHHPLPPSTLLHQDRRKTVFLRIVKIHYLLKIAFKKLLRF